ncbi:cathepsin O [Lampris incognitus]|uniref:cathepsin O n=1 Tax=Lampris incognitus TaxID=2546036 RepID=UPI0024B61FA6|nr:cathepsin O [Lampris incognitus]
MLDHQVAVGYFGLRMRSDYAECGEVGGCGVCSQSVSRGRMLDGLLAIFLATALSDMLITCSSAVERPLLNDRAPSASACCVAQTPPRRRVLPALLDPYQCNPGTLTRVKVHKGKYNPSFNITNLSYCGTYRAFSVVGAMQTVRAIVGRLLEPLSVQQVLDCSYQNQCGNGGSTIRALSWLNGHEETMMGQLVLCLPLVDTVDAVSWQGYMGGIIQHHCSNRQANHATLLMKCNTTGELPYWIVQNSWGTSRGDQGFLYSKLGNSCNHSIVRW